LAPAAGATLPRVCCASYATFQITNKLMTAPRKAKTIIGMRMAS